MTRAEAEKVILSTDSIWTGPKAPALRVAYWLLDDFESRTCENCKHFTLEDGDNYCCDAGSAGSSIVDTLHSYEEMHTFGCNKFERKS